MKFIIALALVAVAAARPEDDLYDSKYDNFNVAEVLENDRLLTQYIKCFLETDKCPPEGKDIKKWIPEAMQSSCGKCTNTQKPLVAQFIKGIKSKRPDDWEALKKKNDPNNEYNDKLEEFLGKY